MFNLLSLLNSCAILVFVNCFYLPTSIKSVLWLICLLVLIGLNWVVLGLNGLGVLWIMVYAGAIAILFIFVVIMVGEVGFNQNKNYLMRFLSSLILIGVVLFFALNKGVEELILIEGLDNIHNMRVIGYLLFNDYILHVVLIGVFLLVCAIGSVLLVRWQS